jgi:hypothetical protein
VPVYVKRVRALRTTRMEGAGCLLFGCGRVLPGGSGPRAAQGSRVQGGSQVRWCGVSRPARVEERMGYKPMLQARRRAASRLFNPYKFKHEILNPKLVPAEQFSNRPNRNVGWASAHRSNCHHEINHEAQRPKVVGWAGFLPMLFLCMSSS